MARESTEPGRSFPRSLTATRRTGSFCARSRPGRPHVRRIDPRSPLPQTPHQAETTGFTRSSGTAIACLAFSKTGRRRCSAEAEGTTPTGFAVSLVELPRGDRRALLEAHVMSSDEIRISETFSDGPALRRWARELRLEGIVSKRRGSRYSAGRRTREWLKIKPREREQFEIVGYKRGTGRRQRSLGALVLAERRDGALRWVGNCGTSLPRRLAERSRASSKPPRSYGARSSTSSERRQGFFEPGRTVALSNRVIRQTIRWSRRCPTSERSSMAATA